MDHSPATESHSGASRRWLCGTLALTLLLLCLFAVPTAYIDPLFHYHAPLENYQYPITNERYQNDGITCHFQYDGIITGTSMTENFKTSEAEALFGGHFIKVPYAGSYYKESSDNLQRAYASGHDLRYVIRSLDSPYLIVDKDALNPDYQYPTYLYNNNPFDDVQYLFNKSILFDYTLQVPDYTRQGNATTTFDDYASWGADFEFGAASVMSRFSFSPPIEPSEPLTEEDRTMLLENLEQNIISVARQHPETTFYIFIPPYSVVYWALRWQNGNFDFCMDADQLAVETLLTVPNIRLYAFSDVFDLTCNLDNYRDYQHYGAWVNSWILEQMAADNHRLTQENYQAYFATIRDFYWSYDYVALNDLK